MVTDWAIPTPAVDFATSLLSRKTNKPRAPSVAPFQRMATWTPPGRSHVPGGRLTLSSTLSQFTVRHSGMLGMPGPLLLTEPVQNVAGPSDLSETFVGFAACAAYGVAMTPSVATVAVTASTAKPRPRRPARTAGGWLSEGVPMPDAPRL